ncbi:MAG: HAD-IA family hydrolase [Candidatus Protistobacter heckmanni]|nr:HAD-IA family hydrolase [Candidatus Protistobacter heckmanni]
MPQQQFDLMVFDWDGTLMDSTSAITRCIQASCADLGLPVPEESVASHVIGFGLEDALKLAAPTLDPKDYRKLAERYRFHYLSQDHQLELFPGVMDMLGALRGDGYLLAVATGKSRRGLDRALDASGLRPLFDVTRCADETFSKPHPAMLQEISDALGARLARTVMIGDTTHDLQMAVNAGAQGVAVTYGAHPRTQLATLSPLFFADSVPQLQGWLAAHG